MRTDYEEFDGNGSYYDKQSKAHKGIIHAGGLVLNTVKGLADWIGLGDKLTGYFDNIKSRADLNKLKSKLVSRINELIQKNDIDLAKLEDQLARLESMGYMLTGIARSKLTKEVVNTKNKVLEKRVSNMRDSINFDKMSSDLNKVKTFAEDPTVLDRLKDSDIVSHVEQALGGYDNV